MKTRLNSLRVRLVAYAFCILALSSLITSGVYVLMYRTGLIRPLFITQLMSPVWLIVMSAILSTMIMAWMSKYYLNPINRLIGGTARVAKGDFSVRLPIEGSNEMQALMRSFNSMVRELGGIEMFRNDFINSFSHEFKTPIVSIRGFARQLLRDDLSENQRREYATIIADESQRLSNLARNILKLSSLEHQQIITDVSEFSLDEQLRTCILLLEKEWTGKHLQLEIDLESIRFRANADMLSQCWVNLLGNAIKFTPEYGTILVALQREGGEAVVTIRDSGIGMSSETMEHMFEKFFQGDTSHHIEGNGLGLAMVKRIIELSGGSIRAESKEGKGSRFTVRLPLSEE